MHFAQLYINCSVFFFFLHSWGSYLKQADVRTCSIILFMYDYAAGFFSKGTCLASSYKLSKG